MGTAVLTSELLQFMSDGHDSSYTICRGSPFRASLYSDFLIDQRKYLSIVKLSFPQSKNSSSDFRRNMSSNCTGILQLCRIWQLAIEKAFNSGKKLRNAQCLLMWANPHYLDLQTLDITVFHEASGEPGGGFRNPPKICANFGYAGSPYKEFTSSSWLPPSCAFPVSINLQSAWSNPPSVNMYESCWFPRIAPSMLAKMPSGVTTNWNFMPCVRLCPLYMSLW